MATDTGTLMVAGAFGVAVLVFLGGALACGMRARGSSGPVALPDSDEVAPPPLPGEGRERWWKVPSDLYNWFDLPMMGLLVLVYAALPVAMLLMERTPEGDVDLATVLGTIVMQFFMAALVTGFVAWRKRPVDWLGLRWPQWRWVFLIAPAVVGMTWVAQIVLQLSGYNTWLLDQLGDDAEQEAVRALAEANNPLLECLLVFTAVVVAPVTEELLFRGYLYPASKRFVGRWGALVFTALVFAVAHGKALALAPLALLAMLLALAYEYTGSLWAPIAIHMLFNAITVVALFMVKWGVVSL